ncbi:malonyl CoA-acyl carrier protein transacylase [Flexistipes sinusarabici DSM 4947]|uniref:Malonyl CoA-acyl carrier protein transacylase n=1 Tax=Flexistipes sinusarabici (strain ATCC 49648 / DSM 4947 / MAS 10) TaxID=717231 RepID=F8E7A2_FLESM|nr:ACP S-malonyltransferase [Flexistipes sinusarabici]AEI13817.1 malonyl CoA-acyl carrier protein transacylase [Flexistipes sinusarabici DSM 4947]
MSTGVIFPGQGSQFVGMGKDFYINYKSAKDVFEKADSALGFSLTDIIFTGPEETLTLTYNAQPALLTTSLAIFEIIKEQIHDITGYAGHSLGEYTAVVAAGGMTFEDVVKAVHNRGKFMQEAVPVGAGGMLAVMGAKREDILRMCGDISKETQSVLEPANFNSPAQTVLAGNIQAVEKALERYREYGIKRAVKLPVSAPFHCSLMKPAAENMQNYLKDVTINDLNIPVYSNVDAKKEKKAETVRENFVKQIASPVLWEDLVLNMVADGTENFIEVGAGSVLTGLMKKIDRKINCVNISGIEDLGKLEDLNV